MKILLTGSSGLLGKAVFSKLQHSPHTISTPLRAELDLSDYEQTRKFLSRNIPDFVIHCAAKVGGILGNIGDPVGFLSENIKNDFNLMSVCADLKVAKFLYFGSSCMYPVNPDSMLEKHHLLAGLLEKTNEPYALAKLSGWKMTELISQNLGLSWKTWILSNLYGPGDHFDQNRSHLLAAIIKKVSEAKELNHPAVEMWGSGKSRREFTFVGDVADFLASRVDTFEGLPQTLNLGSGKDESIETYYKTIFEIYGYTGELVQNLSKPEGVFSKLMNSSEANLYNWLPKTDIRVGLQETISWYENELRGGSND
jgi:GDP-L-fucose synthase